MPIFNDLLNAYNAVEIHGHPQITFPSIWHEVKSANAEVTIDTEGRLISVRPLQKWYVEKGEDGKNVRLRGDNEAVTPVTLYSECRSGSTAQPRPLSDNCKYLIRDPEDSGDELERHSIAEALMGEIDYDEYGEEYESYRPSDYNKKEKEDEKAGKTEKIGFFAKLFKK